MKKKPAKQEAPPLRSVYEPNFQMELSPDEKATLREQLRGGLFAKALAIAARARPSVVVAGEIDEHYSDRCIARLNQLNGWVLHEAALLALVADRPLPVPKPQEEFPDAATVDRDWSKPIVSQDLISKTKPPKTVNR